MKIVRYAFILLCMLLLLTSCGREPSNAREHYIYENVWSRTLPLDKAEAASHYGDKACILGERDGRPVLLELLSIEEGRYVYTELPEGNYADLTVTAEGTYLLSTKAGEATVWQYQDNELHSVTELKLQGAHSIEADAEGALYLAGKKTLCICQNGGVTEIPAPEREWYDLLRDASGTVYAGDYLNYYSIDAANAAVRDCGYELSIDAGQFSGGGTQAMRYSFLSRAGGQNGIQLAYGGLLAEFDPATGTSVSVFDTAGWTETGRLFHAIRQSDSVCYCFIIDEETAQLTYKQIQKTEQKKQIITIARRENNAYVGEAIASFNRSSREYYAVSKTYGGEQAQTQLNLDIVSGNAPDVISLHMVPYEAYAQNGILMDLQPLVDQTYPAGTLHAPALESMRAADGKLYRIAPIYNLRALAIADDLRQGDSWNLEDMYAILAEYPEMHFLQKATGDLMLRAFLAPCMGEFIDEANAVCRFDGPEFRELLRQIKEVCAREQHQPSAHPYQNHEYLLYPLDLYSFRDYQDLVPEDLSPIGFPTEKGSGVTMFSVVQFGICAATEKQEAAWAFLQTLLSEELQDAADWLPLRVSSLEKRAAEAATRLPGEIRSEYADPEAAAAGTNMDMISYEVGATEAMTPEQIDSVWWLLNAIDGFAASAASDEVVAIIREEAAAYLLGDRSVEDVTDIIQNRLSIYLAETRN